MGSTERSKLNYFSLLCLQFQRTERSRIDWTVCLLTLTSCWTWNGDGIDWTVCELTLTPCWAWNGDGTIYAKPVGIQPIAASRLLVFHARWSSSTMGGDRPSSTTTCNREWRASQWKSFKAHLYSPYINEDFFTCLGESPIMWYCNLHDTSEIIPVGTNYLSKSNIFRCYCTEFYWSAKRARTDCSTGQLHFLFPLIVRWLNFHWMRNKNTPNHSL